MDTCFIKKREGGLPHALPEGAHVTEPLPELLCRPVSSVGSAPEPLCYGSIIDVLSGTSLLFGSVNLLDVFTVLCGFIVTRS